MYSFIIRIILISLVYAIFLLKIQAEQTEPDLTRKHPLPIWADGNANIINAFYTLWLVLTKKSWFMTEDVSNLSTEVPYGMCMCIFEYVQSTLTLDQRIKYLTEQWLPFIPL